MRVARERRGLTQEALGELLGCDGTQISHIEAGRRKMSLERLQKASAVLRHPIEFFMDTEPAPARRRARRR